MSTRKVMILALAVLFVFSLTAFAVMPNTQTAPATKGVHTLAMLKAFDPDRTFHPPTCPDSGVPGCG